MDCGEISFSEHALKRMFERQIPPEAVAQAIAQGEVIVSYADDEPFPSYLLLWFVDGSPVHAVVARDEESRHCIVVTVYRPATDRWNRDFRTRRVL